MKHLILTGDDFGRSAEINAAIFAAHHSGVLTQASLMVNEPHATAAAERARENPALLVGLHLTLCTGLASQVSALTDAQGNFEASPAKAGVRYFFQRALVPALQAEITAQFRRFRALGFPPTYWDGHTHLHLHPTILRLTLPIAAAHGFRHTRTLHRPLVFGALTAWAQRGLQTHGVSAPAQVFGFHESGRMTTAAMQRLLERLPEGCSEIYYHPGAEQEALDAAAIRASCARHRITLTTTLPPRPETAR